MVEPTTMSVLLASPTGAKNARIKPSPHSPTATTAAMMAMTFAAVRPPSELPLGTEGGVADGTGSYGAKAGEVSR